MDDANDTQDRASALAATQGCDPWVPRAESLVRALIENYCPCGINGAYTLKSGFRLRHKGGEIAVQRRDIVRFDCGEFVVARWRHDDRRWQSRRGVQRLLASIGKHFLPRVVQCRIPLDDLIQLLPSDHGSGTGAGRS